MNKATVAVFLAGVAAGGGSVALVGSGGSASAAETLRLQNVHVWVARYEADAGPVYAGRQCSYAVQVDGGQRDVCSDLPEMPPEASAAFESWLGVEGLTAPRHAPPELSPTDQNRIRRPGVVAPNRDAGRSSP